MILPRNPSPVKASRAVKRAARLVFLFSLCLYAATTGGSMATDIMTYEVTKAIVEQNSVALPYNVFGMEAHRGVDRRYYAPYGIGHALYSVPFYMLGRAADHFTEGSIGRSESVRKAGMTLGSVVAAAISVWLMFWFAFALTGRSGPSVMTALSLGCATALWPYAKFGFNAPLATLCVLAAVYAAWHGARSRQVHTLVLSGVGIGVALLVRHELVLISLPIALWLVLESWPDWRRALRQISMVATPAVVAVVITGYYNWIRFGNVFDTGYLRDHTAGFSSFFEGALGLLFSPGGSLFLYSPLLILGAVALYELTRHDRNLGILLGGVSLVMFCFYASLEHWDADRSYGPRYLLPLAPMLCLPLVRWFACTTGDMRRRAVIIGLALSFMVQLPGVLVDFSKVGNTPEIGYQTREVRRWQWPSSSFALNLKAATVAVPANVRFLTGIDPSPPREPAVGLARDYSSQFSYSLDFWWVYLFFLTTVSGTTSLLLGIASLGSAGALLLMLRRTVIHLD